MHGFSHQFKVVLMKYISLRSLFLAIVLLFCNIFSFAGFIAKTLVSTSTKQIAIECFIINDFVISYDNSTKLNLYKITSTFCYIADSYLKITIQDTTIITTLDQQFYSPTKQTWVTANTLAPKDALLCLNGDTVHIIAVEHVHQSEKMYALSVDESHTFCVSPYEIVVHNGEPVTMVATTALAIAFPPAAPIIVGIQAVVSGVLAGLGCYYAYKKHKQQKTFAQIKEEVKNSSSSSGSPKKPDDEDDNEEDEHPHGIYKDAPYHHKNSRDGKSPAPQDGQRCLDYSLPYTGNQRIGIEGNTFVLLKQTLHRLFHGHLIPWKSIPGKIRTVLEEGGYITSLGKIIKQITQKSLL